MNTITKNRKSRTGMLRATAVLMVMIAAMLMVVSCSSSQPPAAAPSGQAVAAAAPVEINAKIAPQEYAKRFVSTGAQHQLIDVRTPEEFASGHIAGAVNIPVQELSQRLGEVNMDEPVVLYCRSGNRSAQAAQILAAADYSQIYDLGGIAAWQQAGFPIE